MSQQLISRSHDLKRLRDEGYEIQINGGQLFAHHIPYLNAQKEIKYGIIVTPLTLVNPTLTGKPHDHTVHFCGETPCDKNGNALNAIINSNNLNELKGGYYFNHYFSSKPPSGNYPDFYEKINTYAEILSAQARAIDSTVTAKTFKIIDYKDDSSVFNYPDTNASRANIMALNDKFKTQQIGIIGLGGTGAYILDLVAKTEVAEIHLFDGDVLHVHNAFRSPGALSTNKLNTTPKKVRYYASIYSRMHKFIKPHSLYVKDKNLRLLKGLSFVFICVDSNVVRATIIKKLKALKIPFIDVGLGVNEVDGTLVGQVRVTTGTVDKNDHIHKRIGTEDTDDNDYTTNIQIADLNMLNAALAVIKWKKLATFYQDRNEEHNTTYSIITSQLLNEDVTT